jgi:alpha-L-rhamnosidase
MRSILAIAMVCAHSGVSEARRADAKDIVQVSIVDHGAQSGGTVLNTRAIQQSINAVAEAGGGRVLVPEGVFKTGALFLKQGVQLHLTDGAVLLGSTDLADYPRQMTRIEGHFETWRPALVNASELQGVRITGTGTLDGNGKPFWTAFWKRRQENPACTNLEVERPRLVLIEKSADVQVTGIRLKDSAFWNLHLYHCRDVLVQGVAITAPSGDPPRITDVTQPWDEVSVDRAPSSDGIDVDSCQNVTIRQCTISVGDDCIALKGSKGPLAMEDRQSPPVENVLVEDCDFRSGHGMLTCGSEATIIRGVTARDCRVGAGVPVVRLKLRPDTPQVYENFVFERLVLNDAQALFDVKPWTQFFDLQGHDPPKSIVRNVVLRDIRGTLRSLGELRGNEGDVIENVVLESLDVQSARDRLRLGDVRGLRTTDVRVNGELRNFGQEVAR